MSCLSPSDLLSPALNSFPAVALVRERGCPPFSIPVFALQLAVGPPKNSPARYCSADPHQSPTEESLILLALSHLRLYLHQPLLIP